MASEQDFNSLIEITETPFESRSDVTTQLESDANEKTYNILLFGETGVGKSMFVNAFFHYITYESLDDALKAKDITALVPTKFTTMDNDYNVKQIVFGEDENESDNPDASAIKSPRSYIFKVGNSMIRLIDTPCFDDTGSVDKEEKNFNRLLAAIGELEDIHAICLLLKSNNPRFTVSFRNGIRQLLSQLERSAKRNIVFLFTLSRDFQNNTTVLLGELCEEVFQSQGKNNFCIDNGPFRLLIASKQGIYFSDDEDFREYWSKSSEVCVSLLNYIIKLKPHKIRDTVSFNQARRLISKHAGPLVEIVLNISNLIDATLELNRRYKEKYTDAINKEKENKEVVSKTERTEGVEKLRNTIRSHEERKLKYDSEKMVILKSMAKFAHFLIHNSITAHNDKYNEYLDFLIDRENSLGDHRDEKAIERYTTLKKSHEEEKKRLDDILDQQKLTDTSKISAVTAKEIMETVEKLYELELTGSALKNFHDLQDSVIEGELLTSTAKTFTPPEAMIPNLKNKLPSLFN